MVPEEDEAEIKVLNRDVRSLCRSLWGRHNLDYIDVQRLPYMYKDDLWWLIEAKADPDELGTDSDDENTEPDCDSDCSDHHREIDRPIPLGSFFLRIPTGKLSAKDVRQMAFNLVLGGLLGALSGFRAPLLIEYSEGHRSTAMRPWILMTTIPGVPLFSGFGHSNAWPEETNNRKTYAHSLAFDIAHLFNTVAQYPGRYIGVPNSSNGARLEDLIGGQYETRPFPYLEGVECLASGEEAEEGDHRDEYIANTAMEVLEHRLVMRHEDCKSNGAETDRSRKWARARNLLEVLGNKADSAFSPRDEFYLALSGEAFHPDNLFMTLVEDRPRLSGILVWDTLQYVPAVVAFNPPYWLWHDLWWDSIPLHLDAKFHRYTPEQEFAGDALPPTRPAGRAFLDEIEADVDLERGPQYAPGGGREVDGCHLNLVRQGREADPRMVGKWGCAIKQTWEKHLEPCVLRFVNHPDSYAAYCLWMATMSNNKELECGVEIACEQYQDT